MAAAQKKGSEKKLDLGLLEEDDEFEEFPTEENKEGNIIRNLSAENVLGERRITWTGEDEDQDENHIWQDDWDDDTVEDDFSNQLRAELEKHGYKVDQPESMKT